MYLHLPISLLALALQANAQGPKSGTTHAQGPKSGTAYAQGPKSGTTYAYIPKSVPGCNDPLNAAAAEAQLLTYYDGTCIPIATEQDLIAIDFKQNGGTKAASGVSFYSDGQCIAMVGHAALPIGKKLDVKDVRTFEMCVSEKGNGGRWGSFRFAG